MVRQTRVRVAIMNMCELIYYVQAKEYVARHEGALQERFAMSRSTKDLWARFKIMLAAVSIFNTDIYLY